MVVKSCYLKTALVTGANKGLGYETALALALRNFKVIMADKADQTISRNMIMDASCNENITTEYLDLASFHSTRCFVEKITNKEQHLDVLVNNAGVFCMDKKTTGDSLDALMQVNHLGPFLLTSLLVGLLKKSAGSRIVFVTSSGCFFHRMSAEKLIKPDYFSPNFVSGAIHYYNTKLCNMVASKGFASRLDKFKITCNCLHPGMTSTDFLVANGKDNCFDNAKKKLTRTVLKCITKEAEAGAGMTVFLATSASVKNVTGKYFVDYQQHRVPSVLEDSKFCGDIWEESERIVGISS